MATSRRNMMIAAGVAVASGLFGMGSASAAPESPEDVVDGTKDLVGGARYNAGHAIFVAKDLGGGGFWLTTTTAEDGLVTVVETSRDGLLTVNETVLVPVEDALDEL